MRNPYCLIAMTKARLPLFKKSMFLFAKHKKKIYIIIKFQYSVFDNID